MHDARTNDQADLSRDPGYLRAIMARNNIPADVFFDQIASAAVYPGNNYPRDQVWQGRLSAEDQREFDKYYPDWLEDTRKNDRDDIDKDVRRMQEIMARNNIAPTSPSIESHLLTLLFATKKLILEVWTPAPPVFLLRNSPRFE